MWTKMKCLTRGRGGDRIHGGWNEREDRSAAGVGWGVVVTEVFGETGNYFQNKDDENGEEDDI